MYTGPAVNGSEPKYNGMPKLGLTPFDLRSLTVAELSDNSSDPVPPAPRGTNMAIMSLTPLLHRIAYSQSSPGTAEPSLEDSRGVSSTGPPRIVSPLISIVVHILEANEPRPTNTPARSNAEARTKEVSCWRFKARISMTRTYTIRNMPR